MTGQPAAAPGDQPDVFIPSTEIAGQLLALTGETGPGVRKLLELAANAKIPMERSGRFWGCYRSRLPEMARALGIQPKVTAPGPCRAVAGRPSRRAPDSLPLTAPPTSAAEAQAAAVPNRHECELDQFTFTAIRSVVQA